MSLCGTQGNELICRDEVQKQQKTVIMEEHGMNHHL